MPSSHTAALTLGFRYQTPSLALAGSRPSPSTPERPKKRARMSVPPPARVTVRPHDPLPTSTSRVAQPRPAAGTEDEAGAVVMEELEPQVVPKSEAREEPVLPRGRKLRISHLPLLYHE